MIGIASSGLHSNGYSLARRILADNKLTLESTVDGLLLGPALLEPTRIYVKELLALMKQVRVKGMAHITGSGIPGNLPRCLPDGTKATVFESKWKRASIFDVLQQLGSVDRGEMFSAFNMGLGMTVIVSDTDVAPALSTLRQSGLDAWEVGVIEVGAPNAEASATVQP